MIKNQPSNHWRTQSSDKMKNSWIIEHIWWRISETVSISTKSKLSRTRKNTSKLWIKVSRKWMKLSFWPCRIEQSRWLLNARYGGTTLKTVKITKFFMFLKITVCRVRYVIKLRAATDSEPMLDKLYWAKLWSFTTTCISKGASTNATCWKSASLPTTEHLMANVSSRKPSWWIGLHTKASHQLTQLSGKRRKLS